MRGDLMPTYQSARTSDFTISSNIAQWNLNDLYLYSPQAKDTLTFVNHKIFFNPPDNTIPESAITTDIFNDETYQTWLYKTPTPIAFEASVSDSTIVLDTILNNLVYEGQAFILKAIKRVWLI